MLWTIAFILWAVGFATSYTLGGLIHIPLGATAEANSRSSGNVVTSGVLKGELESFMEREAANPELVNFAGGNPVVAADSTKVQADPGGLLVSDVPMVRQATEWD